jgi:hypothetical protein
MRKLDVPKLYQGVFQRAETGKSLRAAVNAKCLDCAGFQRKEITLCTAETCPLRQYRPYQNDVQDDNSPIDGEFADENELADAMDGVDADRVQSGS